MARQDPSARRLARVVGHVSIDPDVGLGRKPVPADMGLYPEYPSILGHRCARHGISYFRLAPFEVSHRPVGFEVERRAAHVAEYAQVEGPALSKLVRLHEAQGPRSAPVTECRTFSVALAATPAAARVI